MRKRHGFTLIELLTVVFIIGMLLAIVVPAITVIMQRAREQEARRELNAISQAVADYKTDFGAYPPSEPEEVDYTQNSDLPNNLAGFYGSASLVLYLNGQYSQAGAADGYQVTDDRKSAPMDAKFQKWEPRVTGLNIPDVTEVENRQYGINDDNTYRVVGFLDPWDHVIEYFRARPNQGNRTADIYPRAVNVDPDSGAFYEYHTASGDIIVGLNGPAPITPGTS